MCGRARLGLSTAYLCVCWGGVDPGAQSDHTGPHGPAPLPAGAAGNPAQTPFLQRVSSPACCTLLLRKMISLYKQRVESTLWHISLSAAFCKCDFCVLMKWEYRLIDFS